MPAGAIWTSNVEGIVRDDGLIDTCCHIGGYHSGRWRVTYPGHDPVEITAPSWVCSVTGDKYLYPPGPVETEALETGYIVYIHRPPGVEKTALRYELVPPNTPLAVDYAVPTEGPQIYEILPGEGTYPWEVFAIRSEPYAG